MALLDEKARATRTVAAGAALLMLALGGCGNADDQNLAQTSSETVPESSTTTVAAPRGGASSTTAATAPGPGGPPTSTGDKVLGSAEARIAASPAEATLVPVRLDVLGMERLPGDLVEARFRVVNIGKGADLQPFASFRKGSSYDVSGAAILDLKGSRRYEAVQDGGGRCLCSDIPIVSRIPPGESASYYARFGAPPASAGTVDFELPGFPSVRAVPVR